MRCLIMFYLGIDIAKNTHVASLIDEKGKIICILDQVFPEYNTIFSNTFGTNSLGVLLEYSSPSDFEELSVESLAKHLENLVEKR